MTVAGRALLSPGAGPVRRMPEHDSASPGRVGASPADRFQRVDAIFDAAIDVPADERTAFIDRACGADEDLRNEVLELVRAYHRAESVLEAPALGLAAPLLEAAGAVAGAVGWDACSSASAPMVSSTSVSRSS